MGANEGRFSLLAARNGAEVVAIDSDPVVTGSIWRRAAAESLNIVPLVVVVPRPTPAAGWRNRECASFLQRAAGKFDLVMMLAVAHHVLVTERIPLEDLLGVADELSREYVLIEFVAPADAMFQRIVRGRDRALFALFPGLVRRRRLFRALSWFDPKRSTDCIDGSISFAGGAPPNNQTG